MTGEFTWPSNIAMSPNGSGSSLLSHRSCRFAPKQGDCTGLPAGARSGQGHAKELSSC